MVNAQTPSQVEVEDMISSNGPHTIEKVDQKYFSSLQTPPINGKKHLDTSYLAAQFEALDIISPTLL